MHETPYSGKKTQAMGSFALAVFNGAIVAAAGAGRCLLSTCCHMRFPHVQLPNLGHSHYLGGRGSFVLATNRVYFQYNRTAGALGSTNTILVNG